MPITLEKSKNLRLLACPIVLRGVPRGGCLTLHLPSSNRTLKDSDNYWALLVPKSSMGTRSWRRRAVPSVRGLLGCVRRLLASVRVLLASCPCAARLGEFIHRSVLKRGSEADLVPFARCVRDLLDLCALKFSPCTACVRVLLGIAARLGSHPSVIYSPGRWRWRPSVRDLLGFGGAVLAQRALCDGFVSNAARTYDRGPWTFPTLLCLPPPLAARVVSSGNCASHTR